MSDDLLPPNQAKSYEQDASVAEDLNDLWKEIDDALEGDLQVTNDAPVIEMSPESQMSGEAFALQEMHATFVEVAAQSLNPVCRYMKAMSLGEDARELLEISEMIVGSLIPKVEDVGLKQHAEDLTFFRSLLLLAMGETDQHASNKMRDVVMEGFYQLKERFSLKFRGYRLAVRNLIEFYRALKDSDAVDDDSIRRLFSIGIPSLTWIRRTRVDELCSLSGIDGKVMTEIRRIAYLYHSGGKADAEPLLKNRPVQSNVVDRSPSGPSGTESTEELIDPLIAPVDPIVKINTI